MARENATRRLAQCGSFGPIGVKRSLTALFERDREPADQGRDFVQTLRIALFDGARQPCEALVVTKIGDAGGRNRGNQLGMVDADIWHRNQLLMSPAPKNLDLN
jgi:hypothetical protein